MTRGVGTGHVFPSPPRRERTAEDLATLRSTVGTLTRSDVLESKDAAVRASLP